MQQTHTDTYRQKTRGGVCERTHTGRHARHSDHTMVPAIKFGGAFNTKLMHERKKRRRIDYLRAKQLSVLKERPNSLRRATSECLRQHKPFPGSPKLVSKLPVRMYACVRACTQADI